MVRNLPADAGDEREAGLIPGSGRSPGVGNDNPLQYSCLESPMDRGACWATVHGVTKESDTTEHTPLTGSQSEHIKSVKGSSLDLRERVAEPTLGSYTPPLWDPITRSVSKVILVSDHALCYLNLTPNLGTGRKSGGYGQL